MLKRFLNSPQGVALQGRLVAWYSLFCEATTRWTYVGREIPRAAWAAGGPVIVCFWHNRLLFVHKGWPPRQAKQALHILASHSKDGDVVSAAIDAVGFEPIRGSSAKAGKSKGGLGAFREMLSLLQRGRAVGITPDGPRGPRGRAKMGAVQLSARTGAPIICFAWSKRGRTELSSWDRHLVPHPFGRGVIIWGGPVRVARDANEADLEQARVQLDTILNDITAEADRQVGMPFIAPEGANAAAPEPAET